MKLENHKEQAWMCTHCSMCSEMVCDQAGYHKVCPVYQVKEFENYTARGHNTMALYLLEGSLKYSQDVADVAFACTTCGICESVCKPAGNIMAAMGGHGLLSIFDDACKPLGIEMNPIQSVALLEAMRADCVDRDLYPAGLKTVADNIIKSGNRYGLEVPKRHQWAADLNIPRQGSRALFVGDAAAYKAPEIARAAAKIFSKAGINICILDDEINSGALMFRTGNLKLAEASARANIESFKEQGISEIITLSADDYMTIAKDWPRIYGEQPFKVRHISSVLAEVIDRLPLTRSINISATYEDPCHLGRGMNIYQDPRDVLRAIPGVRFSEMYPTAHAAWCCGNCGGVPETDRELALQLGDRKLELADRASANCIVSACPEVKLHLNEVIKHFNRKLFTTKDLTELVAEAMGN